MPTMIAPARLKSTVLAKNLTGPQLDILASFGTEHSYAAGEMMMQPDDGTFSLMVLLEGRCDVLGVMDDEINHLQAGMLLGEVAFCDHKPRSAKAVANGECVAAVFPDDLIDSVRKDHPELATQLLKNIIDVLCGKLRHATRWIDAANT
jgi:CRP-like cAMP-binding protein